VERIRVVEIGVVEAIVEVEAVVEAEAEAAGGGRLLLKLIFVSFLKELSRQSNCLECRFDI
jgi:hypothetical protein